MKLQSLAADREPVSIESHRTSGSASNRKQRVELSVVIPVRNEEHTIPELVRRLSAVLGSNDGGHEIIFVTDENADRTVEVIREANKADGRVKAIKLAASRGQHIAVMAGLQKAVGEGVVVMDGDLQDLPEDIPRLRDRLAEGYDVVYGVKEQKNESRLRNLFSKAFVAVINRLSDYPIHHNTSMFRVMSRRTVDALCKFGEYEPVITGLVGLIGFPWSTVAVASGQRTAGHTKYGFLRQLNLAIGFLLAFSTKPLRMISVFGIAVAGLSFLYLLATVVQAALGQVSVVGWPTLVSLMTLLGGVQLLALGIIGEYVGRIFIETKRRPLYIIDEHIGTFE